MLGTIFLKSLEVFGVAFFTLATTLIIIVIALLLKHTFKALKK
jgi:hypothetical protein